MSIIDREMNLESTGEKEYSPNEGANLLRGSVHGMGVSSEIRTAAYKEAVGHNYGAAYEFRGNFIAHHKVEYRPCETLTPEEYYKRLEAEK